MKSLPLLLVVFSLGGNAVEGSTFKVPNGSMSIQQAINAALPGDVILVKSGTHAVNLLVSAKTGVTLRGQARARIRPAAGIALEVVGSSQITVARLTLETEGSHVVTVDASIAIEFDACKVVSSDGLLTGLKITGSAKVTVAGCLFKGSPYNHVGLTATTDSLVRDSRFTGDGIAVRSSGDRNMFSDNRLAKGLSMIWVGESTSRDNVIAGNSWKKSVGSFAIFVDKLAEDALVLDNSIRSTEQNGIRSSGKRGLLHGNVVKNSGGSGINLDYYAETAVHGNVVKRAGEHGFLLAADDLSIVDNEATGSAGYDLMQTVAASGVTYLGNRFGTVSTP